MSAVHKPKQTRSVESFSDFAMLRQWPSTEEHVFKFHSLNAEQISILTGPVSREAKLIKQHVNIWAWIG